jgi:hypothetical protein
MKWSNENVEEMDKVEIWSLVKVDIVWNIKGYRGLECWMRVNERD